MSSNVIIIKQSNAHDFYQMHHLEFLFIVF